MIDALTKVSAGQDYDGFPAHTYNAIVDVINAYRRGELNSPRSNPTGIGGFTTGLIDVANGWGDYRAYAVVDIELGPRFTPTDDLEQFKSRPILRGVTPGSKYAYAVTQRPLKSSEIGPAMVVGVTPVRIFNNVGALYHQHVHAESGDHSRLYTDFVGTRLLWRESTTDSTECWALVQLGQLEIMRLRGTAASTITAGSSGTINLNGGGTIVAALDHAHGGEQVSAGKEVMVQYYPYEDVWAIDAAECES